MPDIFISYASEDRPTAQKLAQTLEGEGWSVWWDRIIPPGKTFDEVIEQEIANARCVFVLWSKISVNKRWVKREARAGAKRGILIPALVDNIEPPFEFSDVQAASLIGWHGERSHLGFRLLLTALSELLRTSATQCTGAERAMGRGRPAVKQQEVGQSPRSGEGANRVKQFAKREKPEDLSAQLGANPLGQGPSAPRAPSNFGASLKRNWKIAAAAGCALVVVATGLLTVTNFNPPPNDVDVSEHKTDVRIEGYYGESYSIYRNDEFIGKTPVSFKEGYGTRVKVECRRGTQVVRTLEFDVGNNNVWSCRD